MLCLRWGHGQLVHSGTEPAGHVGSRGCEASTLLPPAHTPTPGPSLRGPAWLLLWVCVQAGEVTGGFPRIQHPSVSCHHCCHTGPETCSSGLSPQELLRNTSITLPLLFLSVAASSGITHVWILKRSLRRGSWLGHSARAHGPCRHTSTPTIKNTVVAMDSLDFGFLVNGLATNLHPHM